MIDELVAESTRGTSLVESAVLPLLRPGREDVQSAKHYIDSHRDYTAYHLLFVLRRHAPEIYSEIPEGTKASVLCSALTHLKYLNDWGYLEPGECFDGEAASALLELGDCALECLIPLLDDQRPAPLFGTEEAMMSSLYQYRRSDFAYRYISLILGLKPLFDPKPKERDKMTGELKARLRSMALE